MLACKTGGIGATSNINGELRRISASAGAGSGYRARIRAADCATR
jgi:hypothetical protein